VSALDVDEEDPAPGVEGDSPSVGRPGDPHREDADLANWARHSDDSAVLPYTGVIVTPGGVGWMSPEFHGWVTREDDRGLLACEPAKIDER
jgi:hypothetical protein